MSTINGLAVAQLEDPGAHDGLAFLEPGVHGDKIAALFPECDKLLADHFTACPGSSPAASSTMNTESL